MFINPLLLAGIGGAVVPLVLHLLAKARYRSVDWGAMMFLSGADARQHQSTRLKQWILLLLRMALVALLAMALARPVVKSSWAGLAGEGRVTAVIVLDCSMSMATEEAGRSRFDLARDAVMQILSGLKRGDRAALLLAGDGEPTSDPTADLQSLVTKVAGLKPGRGLADLAQAMQSGLDLLEKSEPQNRRLYVITDRQAVSWRHADAVFRSTWAGRLSNGRAGPRGVICTVGGQSADNVFIERAHLVSPPAVRGQTAEIEVTVRNSGSAPRTQLPLTASLGGNEYFTTLLNLGADARSTLRLPVRGTNETGVPVISLVLRSTGQTLDDLMELAVEVVPPTKVLIVSGDERSGALRGKSAFLRLALAPHSALGKPTGDSAEVTIEPIEDWAKRALKEFQVVVLADVDSLGAAQLRELEQFVYAGGGLLVAPGKLARADAYNAQLYRDGAGLLPAAVAPAIEAKGASLLGIDLNSPMFSFLRNQASPLPNVTIDRFFPATPASNARVVASLSNGQPFCVTGSAGRGQVMLVTTSLDADWSNLPLTSFFLPFVQGSVRSLAGGSLPNRNLESGQPIELGIDGLIDQASLSVITPSGLAALPDVTRIEGRTDVRFADTQTPGRYQLRYRSRGREVSQLFIVQAPRAESDLTNLSEDELKSLSSDLHCAWVDPARSTLAEALSGDRSFRELWAMLLSGVFLLAIVEMSLARRWSKEAA